MGSDLAPGIVSISRVVGEARRSRLLQEAHAPLVNGRFAAGWHRTRLARTPPCDLLALPESGRFQTVTLRVGNGSFKRGCITVGFGSA